MLRINFVLLWNNTMVGLQSSCDIILSFNLNLSQPSSTWLI